jgi:hypothetical protein
MRTFLVAGMAVVAVSLAGCDRMPGFKSPAANNAPANTPAPAQAAQTPTALPAAATAQPAAAIAPEAPAHRWFVEQNGAYGYTTAPTPGEPAGQRAQDVVMLRYAGFKDGYDTLISNEGGYMAAQCVRPCQVIVVTDARRQVRHVALDPASIIGEAFADAAAGQLQPSIAMPATSPAPAAAAPTYARPAAAPHYAPPRERFFGPGSERRRLRPYINREGGYVDPNAAG